MTLQVTLCEAAEAGMTGYAMIVWRVDDKFRRTGLDHLEVCSGNKTVCGRAVNLDRDKGEWWYQTISFPLLEARVQARDGLCLGCLRLVAKYDFSPPTSAQPL